MVGLFRDRSSAEAAIQRLTAAGFREQEIGVAVRDREQQQAIAEGSGTQAAEGATTGALGALVGLGVPEEDAKHFEAGFREAASW